jgi:hypothetical protein
MDKLMDLLKETPIGQVQTKVNIVMKLDKTKHAGERQSRHDEFISDKDILASANKALPKLSKMLLFDKVRIGDSVIVFDSATFLNIVGELRQTSQGVIDFAIITVMRNKNFKSSSKAKYVRV